MQRRRISQLIGITSLVLLVLGAALFAINSPQRALTNGLLGGGAVLFIAFAITNARLILDVSRRRSSRYGANLAAMVILFSCLVVIAQALSARYAYRYDITKNKRFSLAGQTTNLLATLDRDLTAYGFYSQGSTDRQLAEDILGQYSHHSPHFRYELIDPDRNPMRASDMGVENYGTIVLQYGNRRERITHVSEETLTNAMLRVTRDEAKIVYFVIGHGEKDLSSREGNGRSIVRDALRDDNYVVNTLSLFDEASVPDDCEVLIVAGPRRDYFDSEITKVSDYLEPGGNALFLLDAQVDLPNIEGLLSHYGVGINNDVIIDPYSRIFGGEYTVPVVTEYVEHPITQDIDVATFFPMARSVRIDASDRPSLSVQYLASTGKSAWGERDIDGVRGGQAVRDEGDTPAPVHVALIASRLAAAPVPSDEPPAESRIVLFGDSDFIDNSYFRTAGNADLFLNVVGFLAQEKDLISIRAKRGMGDRLFLTASHGRLIFLLCVVMLPGVVIGVGTTVFIKRRNQG